MVILDRMDDLRDIDARHSAITVSQLNRRAKALLEQGIARLWIEGEISNIARPASGHLYFSLKDDTAQIGAAFFRQRQHGPTIGLKNGDQVLVFGRVSIYEARGAYQLIVEQVEPAGEGELKRQFELLKKKLAAEGLFDQERKQALPKLPARIGVITSPSGAAIRDVLSVLRRRFPAIPVVIYPAAVQGDAAPAQLIAALQAALRRNESDVLILTRGGGSLEDLWAFNDEQLAREIAASTIPIVSAIGHEVDFTIADFVADLRAPTPSGAAELVVPDQADWLRTISRFATRIARLGQRSLEDHAQTLDWLSRRLLAGSPAARVARQQDRLREMRGRLVAAIREQVLLRDRDLQALQSGLLRSSPALAVQRSVAQLGQVRQRLGAAGRAAVGGLHQRLALAARALNSVSPLATLDRGYAIVTDAESNDVLMRASDVRPGDDIRARLSRGKLLATVKQVIDDGD